VALQRRLGEHELAVEADLEATLRRGHELDPLDDRRPSLEQLVRQTDGAWDVVSGNAELDLQLVPRLQHVSPRSGRDEG
jgi:hypothetical protein